jgi:hypothetical protein
VSSDESLHWRRRLAAISVRGDVKGGLLPEKVVLVVVGDEAC